MPDREYKIRIVTVGDPTGINQVAEGTGRLTSETQKGAEANEQHHKSFLHAESSGRLFHKILHQITEESPLLGSAMRLALSPQGALLFGVVLGLQHLKKAHEEAQKAAEDNAKESAESFIRMAENADKVGAAAVDAASKFAHEFEELGRQQVSAEQLTGESIKGLDAERDAIRRLSQAQEEFELAQTNDPIKRMEIKRRFKDDSIQQELGVAESVLGMKQNELNAALQQREALKAATAAAVDNDSGTAGARRRDDIDAREQDRVRLGEQIKKLEIEAEKFRGGDITKWTAAVERLDQAKIALQDTLGLKSKDEHAGAEAAAAVERARKAELENEKIIQARQVEIPGLRAQLGLQQAVGKAESAYGSAGDLLEQVKPISQKIVHAASMVDIPGFMSAVVQLSMLPVKMKHLTDVIKDANAGVDDALRSMD